MALPGKDPETIKKRFKAFFYGKAKVGKTTAAIQLPRPFLIDTEAGAEHDKYVDILKKQKGRVLQTYDCDEIINAVQELIKQEHDYKTLIIDPITTVYNDLIDKYEEKIGNEYGKHINAANKKMKHLYNLLTRIDMNVILTAHAKNEYGEGMKVIEQTFDGYKKLDYLFDLIIEIQKIGPGKDPKRIGVIKGSRLDGFPDGDRFEFSYEEIANRYGLHNLERSSLPQLFATPKQVTDLKELIDLMKIPSDIYQKWLDKAKSVCWEEMPSDIIQKCIDSMNEKLTKRNAA